MNEIINMIEIYRANPTQDYYVKIHKQIDDYYSKQRRFIDDKFNEVCSVFKDSLNKDRISKRFHDKQVQKYEEVYNEECCRLYDEKRQLHNILNSI